MGFFDDIKCDAPLPDDRVAAGSWFQSKSLHCSMERFTITGQGRLIFHKHQYESGPDREVRPGLFLPQSRIVAEEDIDMDYHGDVKLGGISTDNAFVDYVARFTHGNLEWIRPYEDLTELHKTWFYAKG